MMLKYVTLRTMASIAIMSAVVFGLSLWAGAVEKPRKSTWAPTAQAQMEHQKGQTAQLGDEHSLGLSATLVDPEKKAKEQAATVEVKVTGVQLIDPAAVKEQPQQGQGHLHYQVDNGPIIATTSTKRSFHELSNGEHKITVMLAGNDHQPLGPSQMLTVNIPQGKSSRAERQ
jgi:hypothetical protein